MALQQCSAAAPWVRPEQWPRDEVWRQHPSLRGCRRPTPPPAAPARTSRCACPPWRGRRRPLPRTRLPRRPPPRGRRDVHVLVLPHADVTASPPLLLSPATPKRHALTLAEIENLKRANRLQKYRRAAVGVFLVSAPVDLFVRATDGVLPTRTLMDVPPPPTPHARPLVPPRKRADGGTPSRQLLAPSPQASRRMHPPSARPSAVYSIPPVEACAPLRAARAWSK